MYKEKFYEEDYLRNKIKETESLLKEGIDFSQPEYIKVEDKTFSPGGKEIDGISLSLNIDGKQGYIEASDFKKPNYSLSDYKFSKDDKVLQVFHSEVSEDIRGKGYGRELYFSLIQEAKNKGYTHLVSDSSVSEKAAKFYKKLGAKEEIPFNKEKRVDDDSLQFVGSGKHKDAPIYRLKLDEVEIPQQFKATKKDVDSLKAKLKEVQARQIQDIDTGNDSLNKSIKLTQEYNKHFNQRRIGTTISKLNKTRDAEIKGAKGDEDLIAKINEKFDSRVKAIEDKNKDRHLSYFTRYWSPDAIENHPNAQKVIEQGLLNSKELQVLKKYDMEEYNKVVEDIPNTARDIVEGVRNNIDGQALQDSIIRRYAIPDVTTASSMKARKMDVDERIVAAFAVLTRLLSFAG